MKKNIMQLLLIVLFLLSLIGAAYVVLSNKIAQSKSKSSLTGVFAKKISKPNAIGIIHISGPIYAGQRGSVLAGTGNPDQIVKKLKTFREDSDIKAVLLRINSPGGSVASVQEIYREIMLMRKQGKIVVASMADVAASGGYYIASAADKIVANPGTITGSIGVIMETGNLQELFKKIGVKLEVIKSGTHKDSGSPHRPLTAEERKIFQGLIDNAYDQFIDAIIEGRHMDKSKLLRLATGRVFTGEQAAGNGLIDELGGKMEAIDLAARLAQIKGEPRIIETTEPWSQFFSFIDNMLPSFAEPYARILNKRSIRLDYILE
ncbi:MAG: signal peptide peptidase SppA [bacterium]